MVGAGVAVRRTLVLLVGRVSVAHAEYAYRAVHRQLERNAGGRGEVPLPVLKFYADDRHVTVIRAYRVTVRVQQDAPRRSGGAHGADQQAFSVPIADGLHRPGPVDRLPRQIAVLRHRLASQFLSVDYEFHLVTVAVRPYAHAVPFVSFQIPVGENVQHGLVRPPRLQVPCLILRESAVVEDSLVRAGLRISDGVRLAAEVESYPVEQSSEPGTFVVEPPSPSDAVQRSVLFVRGAVECGYVSLLRVVVIDSPRSASGDFLCADTDAFGVFVRYLSIGFWRM